MASLNSSLETLLLDLLSQPSAPFREGWVLKRLSQAFEEGRVPHFFDRSQNLVVGAGSSKEYKRILASRDKNPLRVFVAHTDHPGFHGLKWQSANVLQIKWHGGAPTQNMEDTPVWLSTRENGAMLEGVLQKPVLIASGRSIDTAVITLSPQASQALSKLKAEDIFGGFRFRAPVFKENSIYYTKAADDLVGAFAIAALALEFFKGPSKKSKKKNPVNFVGVLTRAEEVGFIGTLAHCKEGFFKKARRPLLFVSLETSRTLPGAEIGKGPVVRLGDKMGTFDPPSLKLFSDLAQKLLPGAHQRRIMDAGTCEGTVFVSYGFPTVGISIPLGNYHNQNLEGGPDSRPQGGAAPEFVHEDDVGGLLTLCRGLITAKKWDRSAAFTQQLKIFDKEMKEYHSLIRSKP